MSKHFNYSKHPRIHFLSKNICINKQNLGIGVRFGVPSSINGSNETLRCKSLSLSHVCPIINGVPR